MKKPDRLMVLGHRCLQAHCEGWQKGSVRRSLTSWRPCACTQLGQNCGAHSVSQPLQHLSVLLHCCQLAVLGACRRLLAALAAGEPASAPAQVPSCSGPPDTLPSTGLYSGLPVHRTAILKTCMVDNRSDLNVLLKRSQTCTLQTCTLHVHDMHHCRCARAGRAGAAGRALLRTRRGGRGDGALPLPPGHC